MHEGLKTFTNSIFGPLLLDVGLTKSSGIKICVSDTHVPLS